MTKFLVRQLCGYIPTSASRPDAHVQQAKLADRSFRSGTTHSSQLTYAKKDLMATETLSSCMVDAQGFESVYKMSRSTFSYVCSLVRVPVLEYKMARDHAFDDGRVLSLQDGVAVALRVLSSGEPLVTVGSSVGVDESTVSVVTQGFVDAMWERAFHHVRWPYSSSEMEKIKRKFEDVHGLPNCCGVLHTAHIKFGSKSHDHEEHGSVILQTIVDPDMRFTNICLGPSGSILHDSWLFKECEKGVALNGRKLKVSSGGGGGSEVGEYIIGDAGYPLRPWLLTPYQLEGDLSDSDYKKEFNRRHSAATAVVMLRALARLKDTWKCLQGEGWHPNDGLEMGQTVGACCLLHNIVIDKEEAEGPGMPSGQEQNKMEHVRQIADEDAVRVRDALSRHLIESGVDTVAAEEEQGAVPVASGSREADRGKEKVHDC